MECNWQSTSKLNSQSVCSIPGCDSQPNGQQTNIIFYEIPKTNKNVTEKWLGAILRLETDIDESTLVCSQHFDTDDFISMGPDEPPKLKSSAVPHINVPLYTISEIQFSDTEASFTNLESKKHKLMETIKKLQRANKNLKLRYTKITRRRVTVEQKMQKLFTQEQINKLENPNYNLIFDREDIVKAVGLYSEGPRLYKLLLEKGYPFPGVHLIEEWLDNVTFEMKKRRPNNKP